MQFLITHAVWWRLDMLTKMCLIFFGWNLSWDTATWPFQINLTGFVSSCSHERGDKHFIIGTVNCRVVLHSLMQFDYWVHKNTLLTTYFFCNLLAYWPTKETHHTIVISKYQNALIRFHNNEKMFFFTWCTCFQMAFIL